MGSFFLSDSEKEVAEKQTSQPRGAGKRTNTPVQEKIGLVTSEPIPSVTLTKNTSLTQFDISYYQNNLLHNKYLAVSKEMELAQAEKRGISVKTIKSWILLLYLDALSWSLEDIDLPNEKAQLLINAKNAPFEEIDIGYIQTPTSHLSSEYLTSLAQLITEAQLDIGISKAKDAKYSRWAIELLGMQKRYLDSKFKTQLKYTFKDVNISIDEKIRIFSLLIDRSDNELIRFSKGYFSKLPKDQLSGEQFQKIQRLIDETNG